MDREFTLQLPSNLEWNNNYRVVGFFGSRQSAQEIVNNFQSPKLNTVVTGENADINYRSDVKLSEDDDMLFVWDDENGKSKGQTP